MGKGKGTFWTTLCCLLPWYASAFLASDDFYSRQTRANQFTNYCTPMCITWPSKAWGNKHKPAVWLSE